MQKKEEGVGGLTTTLTHNIKSDTLNEQLFSHSSYIFQLVVSYVLPHKLISCPPHSEHSNTI